MESVRRLVQAEVVLAELKALLDRPAQPGRGDQPCEGDRLACGDVAVVVGAFAGGQVAADEQPVPGAGGGDPGPGIAAFAFRAGPGRGDHPALPGPPTRGC